MIRDSSIEWLCNSPDSVGVQDYRVLAEAYFVLRAEVAALRAKCDALDDALADETGRARSEESDG